MSQLSSYQIRFNQPLSTTQIVNIYKYSSNNERNIYLHQDHLIADAGHLTKLLSFFLFVNTDQPAVMIIDGENIEEVYHTIHNELEGCIDDISIRSKYSEAQVNSQTSIFV
ncbi:hypothetical protein LF817_04585 [Halobacillus sp. A1]|uniref:hypothetical protein n=1 Tax=Halobacillus sp. A1 TaxID=2880262 RepID=UPI0020A6C895|nr:hypothetical protein [Halobacillus sp. A1]MCP3030610.1 hypothetical protein [Halobacillus sp. A1]